MIEQWLVISYTEITLSTAYHASFILLTGLFLLTVPAFKLLLNE